MAPKKLPGPNAGTVTFSKQKRLYWQAQWTENGKKESCYLGKSIPLAWRKYQSAASRPTISPDESEQIRRAYAKAPRISQDHVRHVMDLAERLKTLRVLLLEAAKAEARGGRRLSIPEWKERVARELGL